MIAVIWLDDDEMFLEVDQSICVLSGTRWSRRPQICHTAMIKVGEALHETTWKH